MKREIVCRRCADEWREIAKDPEVVAAGETLRFVEGALVRDALCDGCNAALDAGARAHCVSVLARGEPACAWENDFLRDEAAP